ncbi:hypothetical protein JHK82_027744 [Glycine max]|nr:hypothetical protein JHK82_027744 [Glycine max]KAG5151520.1 hypothetical protein JHK84_027992 [Glycine max]
MKGYKIDDIFSLTESWSLAVVPTQATILEQAFNAKVPIKLPSLPPYRPGLDRTKHCRYHHNHGHNIEDYWALKDKIEELIQAGCLAIFVKEPGQRMT